VNQVSLKALGEFLRRERERRGLSLDNIADDVLSKTTAWRIEAGNSSVSIEKYRHYCEKFGFDISKIQPMNDPDNLVQVKERLENIELKIELGLDLDGCIKALDTLQVDQKHPLVQLVHFMKAKAFMYSNKVERAEREFSQAIAAAEKHWEQFGYLNVVSCSYNALSNIAYRGHDLQSAAHLVEKAVKSFDPKGERQDAYYMILMNQASYLEKLGRIGEAQRIVDYLIDQIHHIDDLLVKLGVYHLQARLKRKEKLIDEALESAQIGLKIACRNKLNDRAAEFWTTMGNIYEDLNRYDEAHNAYLSVVELKDKVRDPLVLLDAVNDLGHLYIKQENWEMAEAVFKDAIEAGKNGGRRYINSLLGISTLYFRQNRKAEAVDYLKEALSLAHTQRLRKKKKKAILMLTQCFEDSDDMKQYMEYLIMLQKVDLELEEDER
jgi:tetratricopeptide (TPR) repeat protein